MVDILGNQRPVHLIPFLCGLGCKRTLVLEMEVRVSVCLIIIIIICLYIAINELKRDIKPNTINQSIFSAYLKSPNTSVECKMYYIIVVGTCQNDRCCGI